MSQDRPLAERVRELRDSGLIFREVGERLGISLKYAHQLYHDPDGTKVHARKTKRNCVDCGVPIHSDGATKGPQLRCAPCSQAHQSANAKWTRETVIAAIHRFADENGGIAPAAGEWFTSARPTYAPPGGTVQRVFGSWSAAIKAAGLEPRAVGQYGRDGEDMDLCREIRERYEGGESAQKVALSYGCSRQAIVYRIRKAGGTLRTHTEAWALRRVA